LTFSVFSLNISPPTLYLLKSVPAVLNKARQGGFFCDGPFATG
jgi:hypothetical protein